MSAEIFHDIVTLHCFPASKIYYRDGRVGWHPASDLESLVSFLFEGVVMRKFGLLALVSLATVSAAIVGCGSSSSSPPSGGATSGDKKMSGDKMMPGDKMSGDKMAGDKMMSGDKKMSEEKKMEGK